MTKPTILLPVTYAACELNVSKGRVSQLAGEGRLTTTLSGAVLVDRRFLGELALRGLDDRAQFWSELLLRWSSVQPPGKEEREWPN